MCGQTASNVFSAPPMSIMLGVRMMMVMIIILYCSAQLMTLMMMIPVCSVGHKLPGLNPAPDIAFLPHPLLYNTMPAALHFTQCALQYDDGADR